MTRRTIRVLHLLETAAPGGRQQLVLDLASRLDRARFQSTVLFTQASGLLKTEFEQAGIETFLWGSTPSSGTHAPENWTAFLGENRFDILHLHPGPDEARSFLRQASGARVIAHVHGLPVGLQERQAVTLCRRAFLGADLCLVPTNWLARKLQAGSGEGLLPIEVLPNGIDIGRFRNGELRTDLRGTWGFPSSAFLIGTVARLVGNKDVETLLRAFAEVGKQIENLGLIIVGDGPWRDELETLAGQLGISDRVRFTGWRRDIPNILSAIDLFALASWSEGFSLAPLEALAAGKPAILSDLPVYREIFPPAVWPFLVPPGEVAVWADRLREVIGNPELRRVLVREQCPVAARFSLSTLLTRLEAIYESLAVPGAPAA